MHILIISFLIDILAGQVLICTPLYIYIIMHAFLCALLFVGIFMFIYVIHGASEGELNTRVVLPIYWLLSAWNQRIPKLKWIWLYWGTAVQSRHNHCAVSAVLQRNAMLHVV